MLLKKELLKKINKNNTNKKEDNIEFVLKNLKLLHKKIQLIKIYQILKMKLSWKQRYKDERRANKKRNNTKKRRNPKGIDKR